MGFVRHAGLLAMALGVGACATGAVDDVDVDVDHVGYEVVTLSSRP